MSRLWRNILIALGAFVLLIVLLLGFTQTSIFRNWVKNQIASRAGRYVNGQLTIDGLEGNFFTNLQLTGVLLTTRQDTALYIPRLRIDLTLSRLLHGELLIDSITIDAPYTKFVQALDSSWNVSDLIRSDSLTPKDTTTKVDTSGFRVLLNDFILRDGSLRFIALDTSISSSVKEIGLQFSIQYSDTMQLLGLKGLRFSVEKPQFRLQELSLTAARHGSRITLGNLVIRTARNEMGGEGIYVASDSALSSGHLAGKPIDFSELKSIIPGLTLHGSPTFDVETELERDSLMVKLGVIEPPQRIDLRLDIADVSKTLSVATRNQARYYANIKLTRFDLAHWLGDTTFSFQTDGTVAIAGKGFAPESAEATLDAHLTDVVMAGRSVGRIDGSLAYGKGNLNGQISAGGDVGEMKSEFSLRDVMNTQEFNLSLGMSHLNLAPLMQDDSVSTNLNLAAQFQGSGLDTAKFNASGRIDLSPSEVGATRIDTLFARGSFTASSYRIDTLDFRTPVGRASASGSGGFNGSNDLRFWLKVDNLASLRAIVRADSLSGSGTASGTALGALDSLQIASDLEFHNLLYNTYAVGALRGHLSAVRQEEVFSGTAQIQAQHLGTASLLVDSLVVASQFTRKAASLTADAFYQPGIDGHLETRIVFDSTSTIAVPNLALNFRDQHWKGGGPSTRLTYRGDDYQIDSLRLTSPSDAGGLQTVSVDGRLSLAGAEKLVLKIDHLDLNKLTAPFNLQTRIGGGFSGDLRLTGTASQPVIAGKVTIEHGLVNDFTYRALNTDFGYATEKLTLNLSLVPNEGDSLSITGFLPARASLASAEGSILRDRPLEVKIQTTGLPLAVIQASGEPFKKVQGFITADMSISSTINSPTVSGSFGLRGGALSVPRYGVEYTDILTSLSIRDATLTLDTLRARRGKGYVTGSGSLQFEKNLLAGTIKTTQIDFVANQFYLVQHKNYQVQVSGDAHVTGTSQEPKFSGTITIPASSFYLPALMEELAATQAAADRSMPLLVKATLRPDTLTDSISALQARTQLALESDKSDWYKNLRGQFKVTIPRNMWLRSPDMNLEIGEGDIDLVKNGSDFEIFGPLKILRGQYNLYGKRFTILQGSLIFGGGTEYNPEVSMQAQYVFRTTDREKRTLKLDVSGKAFSPVLAFTLDDNSIEERDAIAYVMYGRSMDELTSGQKSSAGAAQGELAKGAAANMLSNQLSQTLGGKLGLDVVDISSQGSLASATVTVGKYITNDLFMSYQRSLGQSQDPGSTQQIVTLEYELTKFLSLQLLQGDEKSSGFDFIFKYQH